MTSRAKEGWLGLNINPHDLPIDQTKEFYQQQSQQALKNYWAIGNDHRDTSYFVGCIFPAIEQWNILKSNHQIAPHRR